MPRRALSLLALTVTLIALTVVPASAPASTNVFQKAIAQWEKQFEASIKNMSVSFQKQWNAFFAKKGLSSTSPIANKGFTVSIPFGGALSQIGGLGVSSTGLTAAVAVGSPIGISGKLEVVDILHARVTQVPIDVALPYDGSSAISLDGKTVGFTSGLANINQHAYAYNASANRLVQLGSKLATQPSISADGGTAAFLQTPLLQQTSIATADPNFDPGGGVSIATTISTAASGWTYGRPQVSGDGQLVAWIATKGSSATELRVYSQKTGQVTATNLVAMGLPAGGQVALDDWSWDGRRLLVSRTTGSTRTLYLVDTKGLVSAITVLPAAVGGESTPTLRADGLEVDTATPDAIDLTDTNNASDLAEITQLGAHRVRVSLDGNGAQLPGGIGKVPITGQVIPRYAFADTGVASLWTEPAPAGGESLLIRTTLPVPNTVATTPAAQ